jgi:hypothetical protein
MFSYADTPVKFVGLLLLFVWCTAWCGYELTRPQDVRQRVSNVLHLAMAVVMLLMVAPATWKMLTTVVPTLGLAAVFALAAGWFCWLAVASRRASGGRGWLHFAGHATMFAAMTWHLSAMGAMAAAMSHGGGGGSGMDMGAGGMGADGMADPSAPGRTMWLFALVGLPLMAYLLASSLRSLWQAARPVDPTVAAASCPCGPGCDCGPECSCYATHARAASREPELVAAGSAAPPVRLEAPVVSTRTCHEVRPVGSRTFRLESLAGFAMNFGMFWMSTGLLVPILPFFAALAF